ncbi:MAG: translocation/assembly module TamB domain-containing protein [Hyphomonadaceae bacterium]
MAGAEKRRWCWALLAGGGAVAVALGAVIVVLGPAGPVVAAAVAEGVSVWRLGKLHVEGVSGAGLGDLRVTRLSLSDDDGVWAIAEDVRLHWRPLRLLVGDVALRDVSAGALRVMRRPRLAPPKDGEGAGVQFDTEAPAIAIQRLSLAEGVAGPASVFRAAGGALVREGTIKSLHLDATRLDRALDVIRLDYRTAPDVSLDVKVEGAAGGMLAWLAQTPDRAVAAHARAAGDATRGDGALDAAVAGAEAARGSFAWRTEGWSGEGVARLAAVPALAGLVARLGDTVQVSASGDPLRAVGAPFRAELNSSTLHAEARGKLNDAMAPIGPIALALDARDTARLLPELKLESGAAAYTGAVELGDVTRLSGRLALRRAQRDGFAVTAEGPADAQITPQRISFTARLAAQTVEAPEAFRPLFANVRVDAAGTYNRTEASLRFSRLMIAGPNASVRGTGGYDNGATRLEGEWELPRVSVLLDGARGAARGRWRFEAPDAQQPSLVIDGAARDFVGYAPFGDLIGRAPKFEGRLAFTPTGVFVNRAIVDGWQLRLGARGPIRGAIADLALEATARGPIDIAGARISGAIDATGTLQGDLSRPKIALEARLDALDAAGLALRKVRATLELAPEGRAQSGKIGLEADLFGYPAAATAHLALIGERAAFEELAVSWARATAHGRAEIAGGAITADAVIGGALNGLAPDISGVLSGRANYAASRGDEGALSLDLVLSRARLGPAITADHANLSVHGKLSALRVSTALDGWAGAQPLQLALDGTGAVTDAGLSLTAQAQGAFAGQSIASEGPLAATWKDGVSTARGAVRLGAGRVEGEWRGGKQDVAVTAKFDTAPLDVLTAMLETPAAGSLSGEVRLSGAKQSLSGAADLTLTQARLARRSREAVDAHMVATLGDGALRGRLEARSPSGLSASIDGQVPVIAQAAPFRLAGAPGGAFAATWKVSGPVDALWSLLGPLDQSLTGAIEGGGALRVAEGAVSGQGLVTLAGGAFEDKASGVKLRQIEAALAFDDRGMSLSKFSATDGRNGVVTGEGRLNGRDNGRLDLKLANMRLVDRPDATATGDGDLTLQWRGESAVVSGDIKLDHAEARLVDSVAAAVPLIDVVEINRPGPPPRQDGKPAVPLKARLDVRLTAPGRVYTRTRGLEAEWSLDVRVRGDVSNPGIYGEAQLVRGDFDLAGRRFALQTGAVRFSGDPASAELDVTALAETPDLTVTATLGGRALDPTVTLTSNPALPEDEVLPQLLFGRTSRELSPFEAAQLAASLAQLAGRSAFDIAGAARALAALDRLEVRSDANGVMIAGGKYLSRNVYVEVASGAAGQSSTSIEWQVRPRLYIISSFLPNADQRVAVRWRQDY